MFNKLTKMLNCRWKTIKKEYNIWKNVRAIAQRRLNCSLQHMKPWSKPSSFAKLFAVHERWLGILTHLAQHF